MYVKSLSNVLLRCPVMLRIGELARQTGTTPDLLRAWERRYGLLNPTRTEGGFRLYAPADRERVLQMRQHIGSGLSAAEAARRALSDGHEAEPDGAGGLLEALLDMDESRAQTVIDNLLARLSDETALRESILPALREVGERWERGEATIAQEHFATHVIRGRLLALARRWDQGRGRRALLACPPGELHDLPLIAFGLALRKRGWRILFLGADTPYEVIAATAAEQQPDVVVLASAQPRPELATAPFAGIASSTRLVLAGAWPEVDLSVERLVGDPIDAATDLDG